MCAFRMWWPSSMVCCRFSLPSCRENMNARSACPFLGPETQTCNQHPVPPHPGPPVRTSLHKPPNAGTSAPPHKTVGCCVLRHLRGFLWIPCLCGASQKQVLWRGRAFSLEPPTRLLSNANSMKLRALFLSQVQSRLTPSAFLTLSGSKATPGFWGFIPWYGTFSSSTLPTRPSYAHLSHVNKARLHPTASWSHVLPTLAATGVTPIVTGSSELAAKGHNPHIRPPCQPFPLLSSVTRTPVKRDLFLQNTACVSDAMPCTFPTPLPSPPTPHPSNSLVPPMEMLHVHSSGQWRGEK